MIKRVIWSTDIDTSDKAIRAFREEMAETDEDFLDERMYDDDKVLDFMRRDNDEVLSCECQNLDIQTKNPILAIADLGLWHGRRQAYRVLTRNVNAIFGVTCGDYVTFYADAYNVHCDDTHHDGTNHYTFRELRGSEEECGPLIDAIYSGRKISSSLLNRYSKSLLPHVAKVYGWPCASLARAQK